MTGKENGENGQLFSDVLGEVMSNDNYLVGAEPEESDWDFSDWSGYDFRDFGGWILREKFFGIPTIDGRGVSMRIVQTDPRQFSVKTSEGEISVGFVLTPVKAKGFTTILIGKDITGGERVLRNVREPLAWHQVPQLLIGILAKKMGSVEKNSLAEGEEATMQWSGFLREVLLARRILPANFAPSDFMVRDRLELGPNTEFNEQDVKFAEMQITQEEVISIAYADYVLT